MPKSRPNHRSSKAEMTARSLSLFEGAAVVNAATSEAQDKRTGQGRANRTKAVKKPRYLQEGKTRLDTTTAQLVSHLSRLRWPRKWSAIRRYDLLVAAEIERLRKEWDDEPSPLLTGKTRDERGFRGLGRLGRCSRKPMPKSRAVFRRFWRKKVGRKARSSKIWMPSSETAPIRNCA